jgi:hypothetical protein
VIGMISAPRSTGLLLAWTSTAVIPVVVSIVFTPIFQERYLAGHIPALALLMAVAVAAVPKPRLRVAAAAVLVGGLLVALPGHFGPLIREDWRGAVAQLNAQIQPGDQVIADPYYEAVGINAYRSPQYPRISVDAPTQPTAPRVWVLGRSEPPALPGYQLVQAEELGRVHVALFTR